MGLAVLSRVLVVNAGSTSLKLSVVDRDETSTEVECLADPPSGVDAVGHRVVHGGPRLVQPVVIDDTVLAEIKAMAAVAPLHNAPAQWKPRLGEVIHPHPESAFATVVRTKEIVHIDDVRTRRPYLDGDP